MTFADHLETFHGLPVFTLPEPGARSLPAAGDVAWRLDCYAAGDVPFPEVWQSFRERVDSADVRALVIGPWWEDEYIELGPVLELLLADAEGFPALRALFLADVVGEECEISWLELADVTPVLERFPLLEELGVRGGDRLSLRPVRHESLRALRFQSGGLPGSVVRAVGACELPALERLELWLGVSAYGGDATVADLAPILAGGGLPALRHLGLQDSELQDDIAAAVASAPVMAQLESLSLSMGTLTDAGAEALLDGQPLTHLRRLDLHHHFVGEAVAGRLRAALGSAGTEMDLSGRQVPRQWRNEEWRYVAVSE
ncbi:leucine-rich repeat domain-containing protein [Streptomyces misionensis]|uniref:Leucine-rich repeat domain-containing protein n=1 Tax=Streptomyces misionensis TaxID=67331 RepID=A0A5C6IUB0_9ACTN|nr:STM4015 family protein [Streptomyces misionensis]TWV32596.1 leucine-rich repeat domain-containing protein [Streptomyces misionensis]